MKILVTVLGIVFLWSCNNETSFPETSEPPFTRIFINASFDLPSSTGSESVVNVSQIEFIATFNHPIIEQGDFYYRGGSPNDISLSTDEDTTFITFSGIAELEGSKPPAGWYGDPAEWTESLEYQVVFSVWNGNFKYLHGSVFSPEYHRTFAEPITSYNLIEQDSIEWRFIQDYPIFPVLFDISINDVYGTDFKN